MWPEEAKDKYCPNNERMMSSTPHVTTADVKECQQKCIAKPTCVGISYSYKTNTNCYLCMDENLSAAQNNYGFYRRPEGIVEVFLLNT